MFIYPYKAGSSSVNHLKNGLGVKVIKLKNSKFSGKEGKIVLNWGNSKTTKELLKCVVINNPEAVALASNKLSFFEHVKGVLPIPEFTTDKEIAESWLASGKVVFARTTLQGYGGDGIHILEDLGQWKDFREHSETKMYVKYIPKKDEYRVHVMNGNIIDVQRKAARFDDEVKNWKVRNYANGFNFVRNGIEPPDKVLSNAILAVELCGLDFGAVDVIWNNYRGEAYVLEVNTAPGLEGTTVESYIKGIEDIYLKGILNIKSFPQTNTFNFSPNSGEAGILNGILDEFALDFNNTAVDEEYDDEEE